MITKENLGSRIRATRKAQNLTLKELEAKSGFSATHISEIERGKTSPTIGALVRIARALEKDASFFLEEEPLHDVAFVRRDERTPLPEDMSSMSGEVLTPGIPGGRLNAYMLHLEPGEVRDRGFGAHPGEEGVYVLSGSVEYLVGEETYTLGRGDAIHYPSDRPHGFKNVGTEAAAILVVYTKRLRRHGSSSGATGRPV